jgi:hypothetical protein
MGFIGLMVSFIAAMFMLVGLIPFLGWLNWFTTLPAAITGAVLSGITLIRRPRSLFGVGGLIISLAVFFVAIVRLSLGFGFL